MSEQHPEGYISLEEAAALAGTSTKTIRRRVLVGDLMAFRLADGRRRYFRQADVAALAQPRPA